ncbi:MAG: DUF4190 domain-containing protein [Clostridia bacterium]|nr:DUF4190 domain-containing protein [Clostridia bacterium]
MDQNTNNVPQSGSKALSIASMVVGIVSLVFCFCVPWLPLILGIVAVALSGIAIAKKMDGKGMAIAGLVTGVITVSIYLVIIIFGASVGFLAASLI